MLFNMIIKKKLILLMYLFLISCEEPKETYSSLFLANGDIIVASNVGDDAIALNPDNLDMKKITNLDRTSEKVSSSLWLRKAERLLLAIDGEDRIVSLDPINGEIDDFVTSTQLNGTLRGMAELSNENIIICESNNIERFTSKGLRVTSGWPLSINTPYQVFGLDNNRFGVCAGGSTDQIRIYDIDGNILAQDSGPNGHDARGCSVLEDGRIVVAWNGANDQVWIYSDDLSSGEPIVLSSEIGNLFASPSSLAISRDNTILVTDYTYHHIVEFTLAGELIKTMGVLHDPLNINVIK